MQRMFPLFLVAVLIGCGGNNKSATEPGANSSAGPEGGDFSAWTSWPKVSDGVFISKGHAKKPATVSVPSEHADWYKRLPAGEKAPVGFQVVKTHYETEAAEDITQLMVMTKMQDGYDPDNGNWWYGIYGSDGTSLRQGGKLEMCINCHSAVEETDFLGGVPAAE